MAFDRLVHTRYCGQLMMEVEFNCQMESRPNSYIYTVKANLGKAPMHTTGTVEFKGDQNTNPNGLDTIKAVCNQFVTQLHSMWEQAGNGWVSVFMDAEIARVQLFNILCQNVEGILQPDQPQWLISDREV